jgi:hypothetical protein
MWREAMLILDIKMLHAVCSLSDCVFNIHVHRQPLCGPLPFVSIFIDYSVRTTARMILLGCTIGPIVWELPT